MKFPIPRTRKTQWISVLCAVAIMLAGIFLWWPDYATLAMHSPVTFRPVPEERGTTIATLAAGSRVRVLGIIMVSAPHAGYNNRPAVMVEVRADHSDFTNIHRFLGGGGEEQAGDRYDGSEFTDIHGWLTISAFSESDRLRLLRKYRPWSK